MSIRFTCTACHTVLKVGEVVTEPKKVRCTGCSLVILLTPDDESPNGMRISVPEKPARVGMSARQLALRRNILLGILAVAILILIVGLWWTFRAPTDRGSMEGSVQLDDGPLEKGTIVFSPIDGATGKPVTIPVVRGRYTVGVREGPYLGMNRVEIFGESPESVAKRYNADSKEKFEVLPGSNTKDFVVRSR